jgi:hypothetical protein
MTSAPQDNLGEEGNATRRNSATASNIGGASPSTRDSKGRKRRRAFSGGAQGNTPNTRGPKVAKVVHRAKGNQAHNAGSWGPNSSPTEEKSEKPSEGSDQGVEPRMFARVPAQHFADDICDSWRRK